MEPVSDLICILLEKPFSLCKDDDKKDILQCERPQPKLLLNKTGDRGKNTKTHTRNFQISWYQTYSWLCGSYYLEKLFCWPCLIVGIKKNTWNSNGFTNLTSATRSFQKHEGSAEHIKNCVKFKQLQRNRNQIAEALQENVRLYIQKYNENVRLNRLFMRVPIDAVLYLSKQELAFRGHDETIYSINRGNFKELLALLLQRSSVEIQQHYATIKNVFSAESKTIQNELVDCISEYIRDFIKIEISETSFFSIQVDDTTDISQKSQCSIILRYVTLKGILVERFLGFYDVSSDRTAEALFGLLDSILTKFNYKYKLVAQCYDGASVMSGHLNGLQAKIKETAPQAVFVHCLAHRLNLVLKQSVTKISKCRIFFASIGGMPSFFRHSAKRTYVADSVISKRIPANVDTRWSSHGKLVKIIYEEWDGLKQVFERIMNDPSADEKTIRQAKGFLNEMNDFQFALLTIIYKEIFAVTDILFEILQKKSLDINFCFSKITDTRGILSCKRNEATFNEYFNAAAKRAKFEATRRNQTEDEIFQNMKVLFFEILDTVLMEIDTRFQDIKKLEFLCLGDSAKFEEFSKKFPTQALENLKTTYQNIVCDVHRLKNELEIIYCDSRYRSVSVEKLIFMLKEDDLTDVFKEAYKLFCLILTIPSTSCSAERSFSCLKRIKSCSRSSTAQERLSSLATISVEKKLLSELQNIMPFYDDIIDKYASRKNRRIELTFKQ